MSGLVWKGLNNTAFYILKDNIRVLVSIDVEGIVIKLLQVASMPVIGLQANPDIFFSVFRVLLETGLDLW